MSEAAENYQAQQEALLDSVMGMMEPLSTIMVGRNCGIYRILDVRSHLFSYGCLGIAL